MGITFTQIIILLLFNVFLTVSIEQTYSIQDQFKVI